MPPPTFLGIGVTKAGTTWLAAQMAQHPDVLFGRNKKLPYYIRLPDDATARTLQRVFEHLGVDPDFAPDGIDEPQNVAMSPFQLRRREMHPLLSTAMGLVPRSPRSHPRWDLPVPEGERDRLAETFAPDVEYAERLLGRRLPWARPTASRTGGDARDTEPARGARPL